MHRTILWGLLGIGAAVVALALRPSNPDSTSESAGAYAAGAESLASNVSAAPEAVERVLPGPNGTVADGAVSEELDEDAPSAAALSHERRVDLLVAADFGRARAEEIVRREAELRRTAAYREYEATGTVRALTGSAQLAGEGALRAELGETDFERYLAATGRSTHVVVAGVAEASAAANAGLMAGDEIRAYGGARVFNLRELNELAQRRAPGEVVALSVVRDGAAMQLYIEGGSLGLLPAEPR